MQHGRRLSGAFLLVLLVLSPAAVAAEWKVLEEHWYVIELNGAQVGFMHETVRSDGARYDTSTETTMKMGRGQASIEINMQSKFIETHGGEPIEVRSLEARVAHDREAVAPPLVGGDEEDVLRLAHNLPPRTLEA